jgi:hypothetical protein
MIRLDYMSRSETKKPTMMAGLFFRRASAVSRAGYLTASGDVGAEARITWIEGYVKSVVYARLVRFATLLSVAPIRRPGAVARPFFLR